MGNDRKLEHLNLAFQSQTKVDEQDLRFIYEPMLSAHPDKLDLSINFLGKILQTPIWVSSMTGGTGLAKEINRNIAKACRKYGMGMGLGSCRKILFDKSYWEDFDFRDEIGNQPFWANLGIAQVEELILTKNTKVIKELIINLQADGLIIHVNPLQEWFQPEGNRLKQSPIKTLIELLNQTDIKLIVKEVGQGFGYESLRMLLQLPLEAIEFGAYGGTNFSLLEMMRDNKEKLSSNLPFAYIGRSAEQMIKDINLIIKDMPDHKCKQLIISGGIKNAIDGYYYTSKSEIPAIFGMASSILKHASVSFESLDKYLIDQISALKLANAYLKINADYNG